MALNVCSVMSLLVLTKQLADPEADMWRVLCTPLLSHWISCSFCLSGPGPAKPDWWLMTHDWLFVWLILRYRWGVRAQHSLSEASGLGPEQRLHLAKIRARAPRPPGAPAKPEGWERTETVWGTRLESSHRCDMGILWTSTVLSESKIFYKNIVFQVDEYSQQTPGPLLSRGPEAAPNGTFCPALLFVWSSL